MKMGPGQRPDVLSVHKIRTELTMATKVAPSPVEDTYNSL